MKAYKVSLYKVNYDGFEKGKLIYIDSVIVKKQLIGVKELLTGYDKIDLVLLQGYQVLSNSAHISNYHSQFFLVNCYLDLIYFELTLHGPQLFY